MTLGSIVAWINQHHPIYKRTFWKFYYQFYMFYLLGKGFPFMNFGYVPLSRNDSPLKLDEPDELYRFEIQLYDHIIKTDLKNKDVLEVGSGRGGGSNFIKRYYQPKSVIGIDFSSNNVRVSNEKFCQDGLVYLKGNAESLPFEDNRFDIAVNVESSHCYGSVTTFYKEVNRVLKPNGLFFYTDFFETYKIETLLQDLEQSGFSIVEIDNISENVLKSMKLKNHLKLAFTSKKSKLLQNISMEAMGGEETPCFVGLQNKFLAYLCFVLQKS